MRIRVGIFWFCNFDIVYDIEEIEISENEKDLFCYSKQHKEVWKNLASKQFDGKYSKYSYDFFQRGRVYFNSATKQYSVVMNDLRKEIPNTFIKRIQQLFNI